MKAQIEGIVADETWVTEVDIELIWFYDQQYYELTYRINDNSKVKLKLAAAELPGAIKFLGADHEEG